MKEPWRVVKLEIWRHLPETNKPGAYILIQPEDITKGVVDGEFKMSLRTYFIVNDSEQESIRGGHYHPTGVKKEIMGCLAGTIEFELHSRQCCKKIFLEDYKRAIIVPNNVWHRVKMSPGAILWTVASTKLAPDECIDLLPQCACCQFK